MNSISAIFKSAVHALPFISMIFAGGCGAHASSGCESDSAAVGETTVAAAATFSADSAYQFLKTQVEFGARVPNTPAHKATAQWLETKLRQYCDTVIVTPFKPLTFDNVRLDARNLFAQINPGISDRTLLLAHWDSRPWADKDPDPAMRDTPVDGANDGASGVAVILEIARLLRVNRDNVGVDILFVDAEDWGSEGDDDSWALGAQHFAQHPPLDGYAPREAILLDMVGGKNPVFTREYFSQQSNPRLNQRIWRKAAELGYADIFVDRVETAVTDDHVRLIEAGIPAVDIIEYHPGQGFNPTWHTTGDNLQNIDINTLDIVGNVVYQVITDRQSNGNK
ncbi:MAG: M28 family peptidase [Muribaculaceae bacterium]|nr:M28 family peptidase [Muribaculaceae bacterium]